MKIAVAGGTGGTGVAGRYAVRAARARGHEVVVISRSRGIDLRTGQGLEEALAGVEVVIDAANAATMNEAEGAAAFTEMTGHLQSAGAAQEVSRLVVLSIVGLERVPLGYYKAKLAQEAKALAGSLPVAIVRTTQFHEFAAQVLARARRGPVATVPHMRIQPVAARSVGEALVAAAETPSEAANRSVEVTGPEVEDLVALARSLVRSRGRHVAVLPLRVPGAPGRAMRTGGQLPDEGAASIVGPTFKERLVTEDAATVTF